MDKKIEIDVQVELDLKPRPQRRQASSGLGSGLYPEQMPAFFAPPRRIASHSITAEDMDRILAPVEPSADTPAKRRKKRKQADRRRRSKRSKTAKKTVSHG